MSANNVHQHFGGGYPILFTFVVQGMKHTSPIDGTLLLRGGRQFNIIQRELNGIDTEEKMVHQIK
jgi:hypothetical protein